MRRRASLFGRDRGGATALEFGLVAPMVMALLFATFEGGWLMTRAVLLDRALDRSVRLVRIGGPDAPRSQAAIRKSICDEMMVVPACERRMIVEMVPIHSQSDFPSTAAACIDRSTPVEPVVSYSTGDRSSIVYVRACLSVAPLTPGLGLGLALPKNRAGDYGLVAASAFLNEPG